jgi:hypothetical protein
MTIFAISNDNDITVFDSVEDAKSDSETEHFSSAKELAEFASSWPASRLIEIWNNLGTTPVKKFTDRKTAVTRIWKVIQEHDASVASKPVQENTQTADQTDVVPEAECATPGVDTSATWRRPAATLVTRPLGRNGRAVARRKPQVRGKAAKRPPYWCF